MTINDLVTHYVTFRRTLGERCQTNEVILRSFCRSVGPQTPVASITAAAVDAFLVGRGPVASTWHIKYHSLKGLFRFAVSRGHRDEAPLPWVSRSDPRVSSRTSTRGRTPPLAGCDPDVPALPHAGRTGDAPSNPPAPLRGWLTRP